MKDFFTFWPLTESLENKSFQWRPINLIFSFFLDFQSHTWNKETFKRCHLKEAANPKLSIHYSSESVDCRQERHSLTIFLFIFCQMLMYVSVERDSDKEQPFWNTFFLEYNFVADCFAFASKTIDISLQSNFFLHAVKSLCGSKMDNHGWRMKKAQKNMDKQISHCQMTGLEKHMLNFNPYHELGSRWLIFRIEVRQRWHKPAERKSDTI